MVGLVAFPQAAQDGDGVLHRGLTDVDLLEAPLQGRVLLDALAVLVQRGGANHAQLTACQHGLEHVPGVHGALAGGSGTHDGVQLVDEGDDLALGVLDLVEDGLEALLELTAVLGPGNHRGQVQGDDLPPPEGVRHVTGDDALGEPLDDCGLADAGLTDEHRVVLGTPGQHLDDATDLGVPADDRIELAGPGPLGEIDGVLGQRRLPTLGLLGGDTTVTASLVERGSEGVGLESQPGQTRLDVGGYRRQRDEQVFGGDEGVAQRLGPVLGVGDDPGESTRELRLCHGGPGTGREFGHGVGGETIHGLGIDAQ